MSDRKYFVFCEDNCKFEGMTREQIIAAIAEATGSVPTNIDDAFITKLQEQNRKEQLRFWIGTQAEFLRLEKEEPDVFYIFTDQDDLAMIEEIAAETARNTVREELEATANVITEKLEKKAKEIEEDFTEQINEKANVSSFKQVIAHDENGITANTEISPALRNFDLFLVEWNSTNVLVKKPVVVACCKQAATNEITGANPYYVVTYLEAEDGEMYWKDNNISYIKYADDTEADCVRITEAKLFTAANKINEYYHITKITGII